MGKSGTVMNLNIATQRELTQLPRVGADKARKIVRYRALRKGFHDWADFARTPGISDEDVEAIRTRAGSSNRHAVQSTRVRTRSITASTIVIGGGKHRRNILAAASRRGASFPAPASSSAS